jgi:hypothetical protein
VSRHIKIINAVASLLPAAAFAQEMPEHQHGATVPASVQAAGPAEHMHGAVSEGDLPPLGTGPSVQMKGALGDYSMMRDASGTSWQPDSSMMEGIHGIAGDWATMIHGYASLVYDHQGGRRGDDKTFSESMFMAMAQRGLGTGTLTLRGMVSLDPFMGKDGYPLLLQTGETANGVTPLIDRQHPHDLFMELAGVYSVLVAAETSAFLYLGYPGEPALGPPTFTHRLSGMENPEAPIGHHWLDSTHITYGVVTAGVVYGDWKIEGSVFNGREPDQHRWNFDPLRLDSASGRLSWNPTENWSLQVSHGFIKSPEALEAEVNQHRTTASAIYNKKLEHGNWQTTLARGRNDNHPGPSTNAYLLESAVSWYQHTVFARAENDEKNELFPAGDPQQGRTFDVSKLSAGYIYDIPIGDHLSLGLGALGSLYRLPAALDPAYGSSPASYMVFTRVKLR